MVVAATHDFGIENGSILQNADVIAEADDPARPRLGQGGTGGQVHADDDNTYSKSRPPSMPSLLRSRKPPRVSSYSSDSGEPTLESNPSPKPTPSPSKLSFSTRPPASILATTNDRVTTVALDTPRLVISDDYCDSPVDVASVHAAGIEAAMSETLDVDQTLEPLSREGRRAQRESIVQRVAERIHSPPGGEQRKKKKGKRSRRTSTSSAISQGNSIAAALAKSGLQISGNPGDDTVRGTGSASAQRAVSSGRSPYLLSTQDYDSDDGYGSEDDSENLSEDEGIDHLPVTGFAVASNRRNAEFHALFPTVDEGDYLIEGESNPTYAY